VVGIFYLEVTRICELNTGAAAVLLLRCSKFEVDPETGTWHPFLQCPPTTERHSERSSMTLKVPLSGASPLQIAKLSSRSRLKPLKLGNCNFRHWFRDVGN
jgi:hypothetical protein